MGEGSGSICQPAFFLQTLYFLFFFLLKELKKRIFKMNGKTRKASERQSVEKRLLALRIRNFVCKQRRETSGLAQILPQHQQQKLKYIYLQTVQYNSMNSRWVSFLFFMKQNNKNYHDKLKQCIYEVKQCSTILLYTINIIIIETIKIFASNTNNHHGKLLQKKINSFQITHIFA